MYLCTRMVTSVVVWPFQSILVGSNHSMSLSAQHFKVLKKAPLPHNPIFERYKFNFTFLSFKKLYGQIPKVLYFFYPVPKYVNFLIASRTTLFLKKWWGLFSKATFYLKRIRDFRANTELILNC